MTVGQPWPIVLDVLIAPCYIALVVGVHMTHRHLEARQFTGWFWAGLGMLLGCVVVLELWARSQVARAPTEGDRTGPCDVPRLLPLFGLEGQYLLQLAWVAAWPLPTVLLFGPLMDGGLCFKTCVWLYLGYLALAILLLAALSKTWTAGEVTFVRWVWVPLFALGVPYFRPVFIGWGLVPHPIS
jgi:hypothetical protein